MKMPTWPGINSADLRMLGWIWQGCDAKCRILIQDLAVRELYKRVAVVSQDGNEDLWQRAVKFAVDATPDKRLQLDKEIVIQLYQVLDEIGPAAKLSTTYTVTDAVNKLGEADNLYVPVLVDIPRDRGRSMKELRFFEENDRWKHSTDDYENIATGRSRMWNRMTDTFTAAAGKIRIFAHSSLVSVLRAVEQNRFEAALNNALSIIGD